MLAFYAVMTSDGTVLIFLFSPVLVLKTRFLRFHGTHSGTSVLVPSFRHPGFGARFFKGLSAFSHFGTSSVPFL